MCSLIIAVSTSSVGFLVFYIIVKLWNSKEKPKVISNSQTEKRVVIIFFLTFQCLVGLYIHPAFCYFTSLIFLPLYGMKFNFLSMKNKDRLKQCMFILCYSCVVYSLSQFNYKPHLQGTNRANISKIWLVIGELYRDTLWTGNKLLLFIWTFWIPNMVIFLWTRGVK